MKKKIAKQLLSLFLSFGMLCGVVGTEGLPISAENNYDISLTITYPRVREVPEAPQDFDSTCNFDREQNFTKILHEKTTADRLI